MVVIKHPLGPSPPPELPPDGFFVEVVDVLGVAPEDIGSKSLGCELLVDGALGGTELVDTPN